MRHYEPEQQGRQIEARCEQDLREPFRLAEGPLLRTSLIALATGEYVLILTLPALCADAASLRNLSQELCAVYASDQRAEEPDDPIQYVQFAEWQQSQQDGEEAEPGKEHWRRLRVLPPMALPLQRAPSESTAFIPRGARYPFRDESWPVCAAWSARTPSCLAAG